MFERLNIIVPNVLVGLICVLFLTGCASSDLSQTSQESYLEYLYACQNDDMDAAGSMLLDEAPNPCPLNDVLEGLSEDTSFELISHNGDEVFIYERDGWKWTPTLMPHPDEVLTAFADLKYALKNHDFQRFIALLSKSLALKFAGITAESMASNADLNDLYASMAVTQVPWYRLDNAQAFFEIPGWKLTFEWLGNQWLLLDLTHH